MALMINFLTALISPVTNIADKMIMDKDKYAELQFKKLELKAASQDKLLSITTTPTIDAIVKLAIAFRDVLIPLFRPIGSIAMAAFAGYCLTNNIELPGYLAEALFSTTVMWGISRHKGKAKGKQNTKEADQNDFFN